jgi:hypothetical protein
MDVNGDVDQGSLNWCPDFGICNQYLIVTDTYTNGKTNQLNAKAMGFQTTGLTNSALIEGINKLAASKFAGPFGTLSTAINWAIYEGYFITNQEYPTIVTSGCVLNLDSNFPPSYPLVFDTWYDLTGNGNTGLLNNGITYNSALRGSLLLNGTTQYVSFSATTDIPVGNSNYTISVWFNPSTTSGDRGLVGWGNFGTTNQVNALKITSSGLVNYWWANDLQANYSFIIGDWYNAVATFDGTTRSLWINGSLISSDTPVGHNVPYSTNLEIGVTNGIEFFGGNMGEAQIFNRALSSTEISDNYNALYPRYNGTYTDPCNIAPLCSPTPTGTVVPTPSQTGTPAVTPTQTPPPIFLLNNTPNLPTGISACNDYNTFNRANYYASTANGGTIQSGTFLYTNASQIGNPSYYIPDGYYSNGTLYWLFQNGSTSDNGTPCSVPTNTPTNTQTNTQTNTPTVTPTATSFEIITGSTVCGVQYIGSSGGRGIFYITVELGTDTGLINFNYDAYTIPDQFQVYWDGNLVIDTGFRGSSSYNADLNALGYPNVSGPGAGSSYFSKTSASPTTALVVVTAPLLSTVWEFTMECVSVTPTPTVTSTQTQTPTPTASPFYYYYALHTCWGEPTSISVGRSTSSSYGTAVFLIGGICFQSDGITSGPSYDVDLDSVTIVTGGCSDIVCNPPASTPTATPASTPTSTPVYYYYLVYDVDINCTAYDGVVYRTTTDYSVTIGAGQYVYVNGNFGVLKYIETTYTQAFVDTLNSIVVTSCIIPSPTQTVTPTNTATPPSTPTLTQTPFPVFLLNSTSGLVNGGAACNDYNINNRVNFYSSTANGGTITTGTFLYTNINQIGNPAYYIPDGYYSNGTNYWFFQNGSTSDVGTPCPAPSQTPTNTPPSTPPSTPTLTQTPFPAFLLNSNSGLVNGGEACLDYNLNNRAQFYASTANGGTITTGTFLYTSLAGIGNPAFYIPNGYYSNGTNYWFFQNGSTSDVGTACPAPSSTPTQTPSATPPSTPTLTQTPFPAFLLNSNSGLVNGGEACLDYNLNNRAQFYASTANGGTITTGTFLYTSLAGVGNPAFYIPNGYYSNGTNYWFFQNGSTSDVGTPCPAPSQTPTETPPNTPPNTPPVTPSPTTTPIPNFKYYFELVDLNSPPNLGGGGMTLNSTGGNAFFTTDYNLGLFTNSYNISSSVVTADTGNRITKIEKLNYDGSLNTTSDVNATSYTFSSGPYNMTSLGTSPGQFQTIKVYFQLIPPPTPSSTPASTPPSTPASTPDATPSATPPTSRTEFTISDGSSGTDTGACAITNTTTAWSSGSVSPPAINDIIYTTAGGSTTLTDGYYKVPGGIDNWIQLDATGTVIANGICGL